jgi:DNA-binding transcriptional MerR regulator
MPLTITEAAALVGRPPPTLRTWVRRGKLTPLVRGAKPLLFDERDVIECAYEMTSKARHAWLDARWAEVIAETASFEYDR